MPNSSFQKIKLLALLVLFGFLASPAVLALELEYPDWLPLKAGMGLAELVLLLFNVFLVVGGTAAFLMLVVGGVRYLTAFGDPSRLSDAKNQVLQALIGFTVLLSSVLLLNYINPQLLELREPALPSLKPVVVAGPDKVTVRVVLDSPAEQEFEYAFSKNIAETVEAAVVDSRKLMLSFNPAANSLGLCLSAAELAARAGPAGFGFITGSYALAQGGVCEPVWLKDSVVSGSERFDWREPAAQTVILKGMITIAVGLTTPPPRTFGYLDYAPLGKNVELTVQFFENKLEGQKILDWFKEFRQKTIERSKNYCGGAKSSYHYKKCAEECSPPWCVPPVPPVIVNGVVITPGSPGIACIDGCCPPGWQSVNGICQADSCNDENPSHLPCNDKEGEVQSIAGTVIALDSGALAGALGKAVKQLEDPNFKNIFNKGLNQIIDCLEQDGHLLLSCEDAEIWFEDESGGMRLTKDITDSELWPCQKGREFICTWSEEEGGSEQEFAQKIVFPLDYLKQGYEQVQNLYNALYSDDAGESCKCENINSFCNPPFPLQPPAAKDWICSAAPPLGPPAYPSGYCSADKRCAEVPCEGVFCDENSLCSNPCVVPEGIPEKKEAPFPEGFKNARDKALKLACQIFGDAGGSVYSDKCNVDVLGTPKFLENPQIGIDPSPGQGSLLTAYTILKKNIDEISSWAAFDQLDTCYEVKSLLKSYLDSGNIADCPPSEIYPCCPPQKLTNADLGLYFDLTETVKNCSDADFFFCNPPADIHPPDVVVPPGGNCSGTGAECAASLPNQICGPVSSNHCNTGEAKGRINKWDRKIREGIEKSSKKYLSICGGDIEPVRMLKAIVANESDGRLDIGRSPAGAVGLFQLMMDRVRQFSTECGIPAVIDDAWFAREDNIDEQACVAVEVLRELDDTKCMCDIRQLAAGYNGGAGACDPSADCTDCGMCLGQTTRRWECLWDNPGHTECNTGYTETRKYAPQVEYCYGVF